MLKVFTAYRTTAALGLCVTAAMTALFIAMGEAAFSIFIIVLGLWITWLASLYKAMREHQAMLDVLYQEMDAPRFIQLYRTKLEKAKPGSAFEAAMRAHIGNAYMMMGGYAEALEWFTAACDEPDVKLLMAENRAACLQRMDAKELPEALETWKRCMQQVKPARKRRSEQSLRMVEIRRAVASGRADEHMQLEVQTAAKASNKRSYRVSMHLLLAKIYVQRGFGDAARGELEDIAALKANTQDIREARKMLEDMKKREA